MSGVQKIDSELTYYMTPDLDFEILGKLAIVLSNPEAYSKSCQISRSSV